MSKDNGKKPLWKKWWFWVVLVLVIGGISSAFGGSDDTTDNKQTIEQTDIVKESEAPEKEEVNSESEVAEAPETETTEKTEQEKITELLTDRITSEYSQTDIDRITINENLGTEDVDDDYIALVYLTWNVKNKGKTSREMLELYSEDLAAYIGKENSHVQELAIFWTVPYLDADAKCSYERKDGNMYEMDNVFGSAFQ